MLYRVNRSRAPGGGRHLLRRVDLHTQDFSSRDCSERGHRSCFDSNTTSRRLDCLREPISREKEEQFQPPAKAHTPPCHQRRSRTRGTTANPTPRAHHRLPRRRRRRKPARPDNTRRRNRWNSGTRRACLVFRSSRRLSGRRSGCWRRCVPRLERPHPSPVIMRPARCAAVRPCTSAAGRCWRLSGTDTDGRTTSNPACASPHNVVSRRSRPIWQRRSGGTSRRRTEASTTWSSSSVSPGSTSCAVRPPSNRHLRRIDLPVVVAGTWRSRQNGKSSSGS